MTARTVTAAVADSVVVTSTAVAGEEGKSTLKAEVAESLVVVKAEDATGKWGISGFFGSRVDVSGWHRDQW